MASKPPRPVAPPPPPNPVTRADANRSQTGTRLDLFRPSNLTSLLSDSSGGRPTLVASRAKKGLTSLMGGDT